MAVLDTWQRINRVLPNKPFADGVDGISTISSNPNTYATLSATAGSTSGTLGSAVLSNGDLFLAIQMYGTGAGQYEFNMVSSGGGTTSITAKQAFKYTYGTGAQIIRIPRYTVATLGSFSITAWNGSTGGIAIVCASRSIGGSGTVSGYGNNGDATGTGNGLTASGGSGCGFKGGDGKNASSAYQGDGTGSGAGGVSTSANGNGAGGGSTSPSDGCGGGGGGNLNAGSNSSGATQIAYGGNGVATSDLRTLVMGGGGGGAYKIQANKTCGGGAGGGILILISKDVDISSAQINLYGGYGGGDGSYSTGGGGGGGGSCLIFCYTATLGTNKINCAKGLGGNSAQYDGGDGADGVIAVHHAKAITGSTSSPSFTDITDSSIKLRRVAII